MRYKFNKVQIIKCLYSLRNYKTGNKAQRPHLNLYILYVETQVLERQKELVSVFENVITFAENVKKYCLASSF